MDLFFVNYFLAYILIYKFSTTRVILDQLSRTDTFLTNCEVYINISMIRLHTELKKNVSIYGELTLLKNTKFDLWFITIIGGH